MLKQVFKTENENTTIAAEWGRWVKGTWSYKILDTVGEQAFDDLTALAAHMALNCLAGGCSSAMVQVKRLVKHRENWRSPMPFATRHCSNALLDERFATNPLVTSDPNIRFYAGAPNHTPGIRAGNTVWSTVCHDNSSPSKWALQILSRQVVAQLELHRNLANVVGVELAQEALRQSENQYRSVVNNIKVIRQTR